jgi:hypothetical protein
MKIKNYLLFTIVFLQEDKKDAKQFLKKHKLSQEMIKKIKNVLDNY